VVASDEISREKEELGIRKDEEIRKRTRGQAPTRFLAATPKVFRERAACQGGQLSPGNCLPKYVVKSRNLRMGLIILIVVILLLIGAFPTGGYGYGYRSHGIIGTILIIVLILYLLGRL
jgi:hypothetical protein